MERVKGFGSAQSPLLKKALITWVSAFPDCITDTTNHPKCNTRCNKMESFCEEIEADIPVRITGQNEFVGVGEEKQGVLSMLIQVARNA